MSKKVETTFTDDSLNILKQVDSIHRDSIINLGLSLVSKTQLYKTLTGQSSEDLTEVASLDSIDSLIETVEDKPKVKQTSKTWDDF